MAGNVPDVPGGTGSIVGVVGVIVTAAATYLGTRYTSRASRDQNLDTIVNARIERIFAQHAADLADRDKEIGYLRDRVADMETKYVLCEARTHKLQLEVQQLKDRLDRPWDGRSERRRDD